MRLLGNIIWLIFGGFLHALAWAAAGLLLCITIIGIPFGVQCFKMASLQLFPFGKHVETIRQTPFDLVANIIWILVCGWGLALANLASAGFFAVTIVGIPFALQSLKLAWLSLFPFGTEVRTDHVF